MNAETARLIAQQDRERDQRNAENLRAWHEKTFGPVVGRVLYEETVS